MEYITYFDFAHTFYRLIPMGTMKKYFLILLALCATTPALARLEFDTQANKVQIYGPYVKYNVLKTPYSIGRYQFDLNDIRLDGPPPETEGPLIAVWPRFLLSFGKLQLVDRKGRVLLTENFTEEQIGTDEKYANYSLRDSGRSLTETLKEEFQLCLEQEYEASKVNACSQFFRLIDGKSTPVETSDASAVKLNDKKAPKNAQITLSPDQKNISLAIKFKSGFFIKISDKSRFIALENIFVDPVEKRLGIIDGKGSVRPTQLTIKDRFFSFIKEKNYFKNEYEKSKDWPQDIEDAEMEFSPYQTGASMQLYGIILPHVPPPFNFQLNEDNPIATYSSTVELRGKKQPNEVLAAKNKNELFIHNDQTDFLWEFPAPLKGQVNHNYLSLQHKNKDYYFSQRIFRAHQTSVAASLSLSTSPTLDLVPGYNFSAEHWFEEIWNKSTWSYQRLGLAANMYETAQSFKPNKSYPEKISINPINFDILYRLSPGVRPVQSTFGLGVRYLNFTLYRSVSSDIQTQFLGIGGFWQTAPQKLIDDIFNVVPLFRYPKWMELSLFYYPISMSDVQLGFSFSWKAHGKMFFAKNWYFDASFNVNNISFRRQNSIGRTDAFNIATASGTLGVGYLF